MSRIRMAVTGTSGQVVRALVEQAHATEFDILTLGRPTLDLEMPRSIERAVREASPDILVSAAAYTDVNRAESEGDRVQQVNAEAPGLLALQARSLGIPMIHLSTDYVFDGAKSAPYVENDPVCPINAYGRSKADGERAVASMLARHVILRTSWIYSSLGRNFVIAMLTLARKQKEIQVVADQIGHPTAAGDIAGGILTVARNLLASSRDDHCGTFHMTASGDTSWAEFASAIFEISASRGGPSAKVTPILTADYQTPAQRPLNSRLDCTKIARTFGIALPHWRSSLVPCVTRLLEQGS